MDWMRHIMHCISQFVQDAYELKKKKKHNQASEKHIASCKCTNCFKSYTYIFGECMLHYKQIKGDMNVQNEKEYKNGKRPNRKMK